MKAIRIELDSLDGCDGPAIEVVPLDDTSFEISMWSEQNKVAKKCLTQIELMNMIMG